MKHPKETKYLIQSFQPGQHVDGFFILRKKDLKRKKDRSYFLVLELGDISGKISATIWNNAEEINAGFQIGDIIKIKGSVTSYQNSLQISVEKVRKANQTDGLSRQDFIARTESDIDQMKREFMELIKSIQNPYLKNLINKVFYEEKLLDKFAEAVGGKLWHHAYVGGLLEHTLAVVRVCEEVIKIYPQIDRDLLISGAIFHDIGKIEEYQIEQGFIDYSDEGRLWGHIMMGVQQIQKVIDQIENQEGGFPSDMKKRLIHMILSHHGTLKYGSPVVPMTLESIVLFYADELDSKANGVLQIMKNEKQAGQIWSKYIPLLERFIYFGEEKDKQKTETIGDLFE